MKPPIAPMIEEITWQQFCNFLKLSIEEFQSIQNELLGESLHFLTSSPLPRAILHGKKPANLAELRAATPLTTYQDYAFMLDKRDDGALQEKPSYWAFTTTSGGAGKWVPYTARGHDVLIDHLMAAFILASGDDSGVVRVSPGDTIMYNLAPPPFLSGYLARGMRERFGFRFIPPLAEAEPMTITERVEKGSRDALRNGVDVLISSSSVLVKMGEALARRRTKGHSSPAYLHPGTLFRLARAYMKSRIERRQILPRDLWRPKVLIGWGLDSSVYRDKIEYYWGKAPYEFEACTEAGIVALQAWNKEGLTLIPQAAFFEFLPEAGWATNGTGRDPSTTTVLLEGLEVGRRYELVLTSFYGMPFVRYRTGHIVKVLSLNDPETGVRLPQVAFVGRCGDVIDLAGFTRLDEKTVWQAICRMETKCSEWVAGKEYNNGNPLLHVFLEVAHSANETELTRQLHATLKAIDPSYNDIEAQLGLVPMQVTALAPGSFQRYYDKRQELGEDITKARLPHINPNPDAIKELLQISAGGTSTPARDRAA